MRFWCPRITRSEGLPLVHWNLGNFATLVHVGAFYRLELQVACNTSVDQEFDKLTIGHQKLGNEIHIPVSRLAKTTSYIHYCKVNANDLLTSPCHSSRWEQVLHTWRTTPPTGWWKQIHHHNTCYGPCGGPSCPKQRACRWWCIPVAGNKN